MSNATRIGGCTLSTQDFNTLCKFAEELGHATIETAVGIVLSEWAEVKRRDEFYAAVSLDSIQNALPFEYELSFRTMNALKKHETMTGAPLDLSDLVRVAEGTIDVRSLGVTGINNLRSALHEFNPECFTEKQMIATGAILCPTCGKGRKQCATLCGRSFDGSTS